MATNPRSGKISDMDLLPVVTGEEYLEVIRKELDGSYKNFRLLVSEIRTNTGLSAFEAAVVAGFVGTEAEWLAGLNGKSVYAIAVEAGFVGTEAEYLESLKGSNGQSAFDLAVEKGFVGTEEDFLNSMKGTDGAPGVAGTDGAAGKSAFDLAVEAGYIGTEEELATALNNLEGSATAQVAGAVFVRNVTPLNPLDNVGNKVYANDDKTLLSCSATTRNVTVHLDAITGNTSYKPVITHGLQQVTLTQSPSNELIWKGQLVVENVTPDETGFAVLKFQHNDGAVGSVSIVADVAPAISRAVFTGAYPGTQTELKANDKVSISFDADTDVVGYEIRDSGALKAASGALAAGVTHTVDNLSVADRGVEPQALAFEIRVKKAGGAWSEWYSSALGGAADFVNVVTLNNVKPSIVVGSIDYPGSQTAIKGEDQATVNYVLDNYTGSVSVNPIGTSLETVTVDETHTVVKIAAGATNSSGNNLSITLTRAANGSTSTVNASVAVATEAPSVAITLPAARLRSGGNHETAVQSHTVTLTSSQALVSAPTLAASVGTWEAAAWSANGARTVWTRKLNIHDDDVKGEATFSGLSATSTAGLEATVIATGAAYTVGGFVKRILSVSPWANRTTALGTMVVDTAKLRCSNLSKGQQGSLNTVYKADDADLVNTYTIKDGNTWYNCDVVNAVSNTQGMMKVEIEEIV